MNRLSLYRRHLPDCRFRLKGSGYTKCDCPIWVDGYLNSRRYRRSLKLRDWARAVRRIEELEADPEKASVPAVTIKATIAAYLRDAEARKLAESTVTRYRKALAPFREFCDARRITLPRDVDLDLLSAYREGRNVMASTQATEIETLRAYFAFCQERGWITANPAKKLKPPKDDSEPTLPFSQAEIDALLGACDRITNSNQASAARARIRARALVLLLLYSGLRISDAGQLRRDAMGPDGRLFLRAMKTGASVYVKLPRVVLDALDAMPRESEVYFFWSGSGKLSSILGSMRRTVECLGRLAVVDGKPLNAHPHRFRDTFAVRLLEHDVPIRTVQLLLGHERVETTERHYAPFMREHQRMLDSAVALLDFHSSESTSPRRSGQ